MYRKQSSLCSRAYGAACVQPHAAAQRTLPNPFAAGFGAAAATMRARRAAAPVLPVRNPGALLPNARAILLS